MKRTNVIKKIVTIGTVAALSTSMLAMPVIAGQFVTDANGKWYKNDDGSYPKSEWKWIDDDGDGNAYSYYFDDNGYVVIGLTPDGYTTDATGAWIENGIAKIKNMTLEEAASAAVDTASKIAEMLTSSGKASQSAVDAVNGITDSSSTSTATGGGVTKQLGVNVAQYSTDISVDSVVKTIYSSPKSTANSGSGAVSTEDDGPDMSKTSYDTFGPSVPADAVTQQIAPTTDTSTISVAGPDGYVPTEADLAD